MTNPAEEFPAQAPAAPAQPTPSAQPPSAATALAPAVNDPRRKKPFLATVLSIMPGLGQVYVGYYKRGFIHAFTVGFLITFLATGVSPLTPLAGIFLAFFWLWVGLYSWVGLV